MPEPQGAVFWSQWGAHSVAQAQALAVDLDALDAAVRRADGRSLFVVA